LPPGRAGGCRYRGASSAPVRDTPRAMIDNLVILLMGMAVVFVAFRAVRMERGERAADKAVTRHRRG
jgi:hypothetical protein